MTRPIRALISYCHKDEEFRQALVTSLSAATRAGEIELWSDHKILPGRNIDEAILAKLTEAELIILLVSRDFIASEYCFTTELKIALDRHANGRAVVVPIHVRATDFKGAPFERMKMLPNDARPITSWSNQDEAWVSVASGIREAISGLDKIDTATHVFRSATISECLRENFDELQRRFENPDSVYKSAFGFRILDELVGIPNDGDLNLIAGRPGSGQNELAFALVLYSGIKNKKKILVLSQRFASQQYANRLLCATAYVSRSRLASGELEDEDWSRITSGIRMLKEVDLTIDDEQIRTVQQLYKKLSALRSLSYDIVIVDGIEYIAAGSKESGSSVALTLKDHARVTNSVVVATLSLGALPDSRNDRPLAVSDLTERPDFVGLADKIILSYMPDLYSATSSGSVDLQVTVARTPDGSPGSAALRLIATHGAIYAPDELSKLD